MGKVSHFGPGRNVRSDPGHAPRGPEAFPDPNEPDGPPAAVWGLDPCPDCGGLAFILVGRRLECLGCPIPIELVDDDEPDPPAFAKAIPPAVRRADAVRKGA